MYIKCVIFAFFKCYLLILEVECKTCLNTVSPNEWPLHLVVFLRHFVVFIVRRMSCNLMQCESAVSEF